MRRAARLHADKTRRQLRKEWQNLRSSQRLTDDHVALCVDAVNLKNVLGQIKADRANLNNGWLPYARECLTAFTPWHLDAVSGSHRKRCLKAVGYAACATGWSVLARQFHGMSSFQRLAGQSSATLAMTSAMYASESTPLALQVWMTV